MKNLFVFVIFLTGNFLLAQQIDFDKPVNTFIQVKRGDMDIADVDNDGDKDVIISGSLDDSYFINAIALYLNKGDGNFIEDSGIPFHRVYWGTVDFDDVDNDGDQDVILTGMYRDNSYEVSTATLYFNNGTGHYTEAPVSPFFPVFLSATALADVDGDGDRDILIAGRYLDSLTNLQRDTTILYFNIGNGNYTPSTDTIFPQVFSGPLAFGDIDNDGDQDLIISGAQGPNTYTVKLFTNDGTGHFTEVPNTPFPAVSRGKIIFVDIDNDNDNDVLFTGNYLSKLFRNDGNGNFTEIPNTPFPGIKYGDAAFADADNDGDLDLLLTGRTGYNTDQVVTSLYLNDGTGNFTEDNNTPFPLLVSSTVLFDDMDADGDPDVILSGYYFHDGYYEPLTKYFTNDGNGNFTEKRPSVFAVLNRPISGFSDMDNDGDPDLLLTGDGIIKIYLNDGTGLFAEAPSTSLPPLSWGNIRFADVDNDGDEDLFMGGWSNSSSIFKFFRNEGNLTFTEINNSFPSTSRALVMDLGDIDGDGDLDMVMDTMFLMNDGHGNYTLGAVAPFSHLLVYKLLFFDMENDGDEDLFVAGEYQYDYAFLLYENDGSGNYTQVPNTPFTAWTALCAYKIFDANNDGYMDILIYETIYFNDGNGNFTPQSYSSFPVMGPYDPLAADFDNDGDTDLLFVGYAARASYNAKLFANDGNGNFTEVPDTPLIGVNQNSAADFADVDNDGYPDVFIAGTSALHGRISLLYKNISAYTSVRENTFDKKILIYPNPVSHLLEIKMPEDGNYLLYVTDLNGKVWKKSRMSGKYFRLPLTELASGIYILRIVDNNTGKYINKLIIKEPHAIKK